MRTGEAGGLRQNFFNFGNFAASSYLTLPTAHNQVNTNSQLFQKTAVFGHSCFCNFVCSFAATYFLESKSLFDHLIDVCGKQYWWSTIWICSFVCFPTNSNFHLCAGQQNLKATEIFDWILTAGMKLKGNMHVPSA